MNLQATIEELRTERARLDAIIQTLTRLTVESAATQEAKRPGRKSMDLDARQQVSKRMKRYWAQRRKTPQQMASL